MWQTLHSHSCKEKLLLTGREVSSETRLYRVKSVQMGRGESHCHLGFSLRCGPLALVAFPPSSIFILSLQHWNVNTPLLASPLWIFRWLQPRNLPSASPHNCSGWGGIPRLNDTCGAAHLRATGRTPRACSVKKEHFIARDYKPGTMAKCFHYITIATHVSGNSTYKARWIEISEIIMQSAL